MRPRFTYDAVVKDLFQKDQPSLLSRLAGGLAVKASLNVELPTVLTRIADLLFQMADDSITHVEVTSENEGEMPYRKIIYGGMTGQKFPWCIRIDQIVLYIGRAKMNMPDGIDLGCVKCKYRLIDIREIDAEALIASGNPGDLALAFLAGGGLAKLRKILRKANLLPGPRRERVLTQIALLSGLRGVSERLTMEFNRMALEIDIDENAFLRNIRDTAYVHGRAEGIAEGIAEGKAVG